MGWSNLDQRNRKRDYSHLARRALPRCDRMGRCVWRAACLERAASRQIELGAWKSMFQPIKFQPKLNRNFP